LCSCMEATMHGTLFDSLHFFIEALYMRDAHSVV